MNLLKINLFFFRYSDTEQLMGTLSVSDLRGLNYESINNLVLPVLDFLAVCTKLFKNLQFHFILYSLKIFIPLSL